MFSFAYRYHLSFSLYTAVSVLNEATLVLLKTSNERDPYICCCFWYIFLLFLVPSNFQHLYIPVLSILLISFSHFHNFLPTCTTAVCILVYRSLVRPPFRSMPHIFVLFFYLFQEIIVLILEICFPLTHFGKGDNNGAFCL